MGTYESDTYVILKDRDGVATRRQGRADRAAWTRALADDPGLDDRLHPADPDAPRRGRERDHDRRGREGVRCRRAMRSPRSPSGSERALIAGARGRGREGRRRRAGEAAARSRSDRDRARHATASAPSEVGTRGRAGARGGTRPRRWSTVRGGSRSPCASRAATAMRRRPVRRSCRSAFPAARWCRSPRWPTCAMVEAPRGVSRTRAGASHRGRRGQHPRARRGQLRARGPGRRSPPTCRCRPATALNGAVSTATSRRAMRAARDPRAAGHRASIYLLLLHRVRRVRARPCLILLERAVRAGRAGCGALAARAQPQHSRRSSASSRCSASRCSTAWCW